MQSVRERDPAFGRDILSARQPAEARHGLLIEANGFVAAGRFFERGVSCE
jgi:hypothetical protein